jgi:hypothetical protein
MTTVLALDLASVSGWAVGEPGKEPAHGSIRFASVGASHEAVFAGAFKWMINMVAEHQPSLIVWESPAADKLQPGPDDERRHLAAVRVAGDRRLRRLSARSVRKRSRIMPRKARARRLGAFSRLAWCVHTGLPSDAPRCPRCRVTGFP